MIWFIQLIDKKLKSTPPVFQIFSSGVGPAILLLLAYYKNDIWNLTSFKVAFTFALFFLTMLGKTQIVKAYLETYPQYLYARGAHGYTLLHDAQRGGEDAKELVDYLQSKGLKETRTKL